MNSRTIRVGIASLVIVVGCLTSPTWAQTMTVQQRLSQYVPVRLTTDLSALSGRQKRMIPILIEAAKIMDACFWYEAYGDREQLMKRLDDPVVRRFAQINYGPWDRLNGNEPFVAGVGPKPPGANFYPADMTKEEFEAVSLSGKDSLYTFVRRDDDGSLKVVPYHEQFSDSVSRAAQLLREAAALAEDAGLRRYLLLRADALLTDDLAGAAGEYREVLEAYRMFAHDKGWLRRLNESVQSGVVAEVAVERVQSEARSRMERAANPYLRDRLHDLDDLANRLLKRLSGGEEQEIPENAILVARHIGPGELLDYGKSIGGLVLEEGGVGSHAAIVARAMEIPMVVGAERIVAHAQNGDPIALDGDAGTVFLRPDEALFDAMSEKIAVAEAARARYEALRDLPATSRDGQTTGLFINAGLVSDLPQLFESGAQGVGLYRTELQFLIRASMPTRTDLAAVYGRVLDAARGAPVVFRTLDIGSDKVLPYMQAQDEPNPALGWRAIRVGLDKPGVMRMQLQALLRAANGRPLSIMFPFVAQYEEYTAARAEVNKAIARETKLGHALPEKLEIGAMLETPSLAFACKKFYEEVEFLSIGGNDLKQFFFAADRENERVRRRYDTLNVSFLSFIEDIIARCKATNTRLSFCGEDAGRPVEALCLAAIGLHSLSMRPASVGPVKHLLRRCNLDDVRKVIHDAQDAGEQSVRPAVMEYLRGLS